MVACDVCGIRSTELFPIHPAQLAWRDRAGRQVARLDLCRGCIEDLARRADRRAQAQVERLTA